MPHQRRAALRFPSLLPPPHPFFFHTVADPVHVAFSHHGILGSRYAPPVQDFPASEMEAVPDTSGFRVRSVVRARKRLEGPATPAPPPAEAAAPRTTIEFSPPGLKVHYTFGALGGSNMLTYSVPTAPGRSRIFFSVLRPAAGTPRLMGAILRLVGLPAFRWKQHAGNNAVLSGDNVLCGAQTALLDALAAEGKTYKDAFYTPTGADSAGEENTVRRRGWRVRGGRCFLYQSHQNAGRGGVFINHLINIPPSLPPEVLRLRAWFEAAPPIPWAPTSPPPPPPADRRALLERLESHTKICSHCSKALKVFTAVRACGVGVVGGAAVWTIAARAAGRAVPPVVLIAAALAAALAAGAHKEVQGLTFVDYVHQEKD